MAMGNPLLKKTVSAGLIASLLVSQQGSLLHEVFAQTVTSVPSGEAGAPLGSAGAGSAQMQTPSNFSLNNAAPLSNQGLPAVQALPALALPQPAAKTKAAAAQAAQAPAQSALIRKAEVPGSKTSAKIAPVRSAPKAPAADALAPKSAPAQKALISQLEDIGRSLIGVHAAPAKTFRQVYDNSTAGQAEDGGSVEGNLPAGPRASLLLKRVLAQLGSDAIGADKNPLSTEEYQELKELKQVLGDGTVGKNGQIEPFGFAAPGGGIARARAAGLEGFLYSKLENERAFGDALSGQVENYFNYLDALYAPVSWMEPMRAELSSLRGAAMSAGDKNQALNSLLIRQVRDLQARLQGADRAAWGRSANIYMILARAYNRMKPGKNFFDSIDDSEFARIRKETHANTIWLLDVFDIGVPRRWGTGGGSPYAMQGYHIKGELGGDEAFKDLIRRAHDAGLRVMTDFIPNHQSLDSDLIKEAPEATIHIVPPQDMSDEDIMRGVPRESGGQRLPVFYLVETDNYPENGKRVHKKILVHHPRTDYGDVMWIDMAQIDHSKPEALAWQVAQARKLAEQYGVDGVRRDMAYYLTNASYYGRWIGLLQSEAPQAAGWARDQILKYAEGLKARQAENKGKEFWADFAKGVKTSDPSFFTIDEVYSNSTDMSRAGSDGVYNKNDHDTSLGQNGLYDAMVSRNAAWIRAALKNAAFRAWQRGGAGLVNFIGTHDGGEGNPWDKFGRIVRSAIATALIFRPTILYNGVEQGVGQGRNLNADLSKSVDREKAIPFDIPVSLNWNEVDQGNKSFLETTLGVAERNAELLRKGAVDVLDPAQETAIVAYTVGRVDEATGRQKAILVAANYSEDKAWGKFHLGNPLLKQFGAFRPIAGRTYVLRDFADKGPDGQPKTYVRTGDELLKDGMTVGLDGGKAHVFEIEELDANAPQTGPPQSGARTLGFDEDLSRAEAGIQQSAPAPLQQATSVSAPQATAKKSFWKATWDVWTQRLTSFSMFPFALLQLPQIIKNAGNLFAGHAAALSGLPWMGYSTGILGNMLLLSYFSGNKEKSAAAAQAVGVIESSIVITQIFLAGFMPAIAFSVVMPVVVAGLTLNVLKAFGKLPDKVAGIPVWSVWNKFTNLLGFFALPLGFAMTFGLAQAHMMAALVTSVAFAATGLVLTILDSQGRMKDMPSALQWVWKKAGACLASLLFMFGPVSQLMGNVKNPAGMAGISVETLLLAMAGNMLMLPRALYVKDKLWFVGSSWGVWLGGWAVLLSMMLGGFLSPVAFSAATAALVGWMTFILRQNRKAK